MNKSFEILLVEDSPGDVRLTQEAFKQGKLLHNLHVVEDGVQAMDFLLCEGEFENSVEPDLILLDLNMPRKGGQEVLEEIKKNEKLRKIPVIILTTSDAEHDILKSYNNHANCYITKPVKMSRFLEVIRTIEDFWLTIVKLPSKKA